VLAAFARAGCRVVVQPGFNRDHMIEDALVRVSRAEQRIGASGTDMFITARQRARGDRWYTRVVPERHGQPHDIERNAHFAWALTGSTLAAPWPHLQRPPRPASAPRDGYIVVASEASAALKAWPAERFFAAAQAVAAPAALRLVLVGQTRGAQPAPEGALDLRGQTTLAALVGLLAHARLVMANDSSPAHLAAALGVPVVVVSGGGMPGRYLPYPPGTAATGQPGLVMVEPAWPCFGCGWRCRYALGRETSTPCVTAVGVEQVVLAARALLS
jgi:ADP-heptose:LPS heptosyltransferase